MATHLLAEAEEDDEEAGEGDDDDPGDSVFADTTSSLTNIISSIDAFPVQRHWSRKLTITLRAFFSVDLSSRKLKWAHIVLNLIAIMLSTLIFFQLGWSVKDFSNQCVLYANMHLVRDNSSSNETIIRVQQTTQWGTIQTCQFCIYLNVCISIIQFLWTWFLIMFSIKSVAEDDIEILIYLPNFLTTVVATLMTLVSSGMISAGFSAWCHSIESVGDCSSLSAYKWAPDSGYSSGYTRLQISEICSWLLVVVLIGTLVVVLYRICKDNALAAKYYKPDEKTRKKSTKKASTSPLAASSPGWSPYRRPTSASLPSHGSTSNLGSSEQIRMRKVRSQGDNIGIEEEEEQHVQRRKSVRKSTVSTRQTRI